MSILPVSLAPLTVSLAGPSLEARLAPCALTAALLLRTAAALFLGPSEEVELVHALLVFAVSASRTSASSTRFVGGSAPLGLPRLAALRGFGRGRDAGSIGSFTERTAALQSFVDTAELGAGLGGVRRSSFFASVLSKLGMPEVAPLGVPFRQAQALAMSGADAEVDLRLANCDGCLRLLPAAAVPEVLADIGQRFCRLTGFVSTGAIRADRLVRALSARLVPTTAFVKSTA